MSCLACGNSVYRDLFVGIKSCSRCRFAWADIKLSEDQWSQIYNKNYFFGEEYLNYLEEEKALRKNFQRNLNFMSSYCGKGKLLEIGCAYGFFLDEARKYYEVTGIDIHAEGCQYSKEKFGLSTQAGNFLTMPIEPRSYDAVAMWDMLEHVPNPQEFIAKASDVLKDKGFLFFCTLDITSLLAKMQGRSWRQIHPPSHVSYFSRASLEIMLKRLGFKTMAIKYFGEYRTWDNTWFNLLVLRLKQKNAYNFFKGLGFLKGEYYLNTFDHVYIAAQKN